jgi:Domain of unknown function (DUF4383)
MSTAQRITVGFGIVYLAVGVLGFVPGITVAASQPGQGLLLGSFAVNALHNVTDLLVGAVLVWAGLAAAPVTTAVNRALAGVFALLVVASFVAPIVEGVALNPPDTLLHLASALVTGYLGFMAERRAVGATA